MKPIIFKALTFFLSLLFTFVLCEFSVRELPNISANKDKVAFYVLGGSTAFGEPYNDKPSFIRLITEKINNSFETKDIEVIMIAQGGKNILSNYFDFLGHKILNPHKENYTFIYTGINEGANTGPKKHNILIEKIFLSSYVGTFLYDFLIQRKVIDFHDSPFLFNQRINQLFKIASNNSTKVFASTIAGNYHDFAPPINSTLSPNELKKHLICEGHKNNKERVACLKNEKFDTAYIDYENSLNNYFEERDPHFLNKLVQSWNFYESKRPAQLKNQYIQNNIKLFENIQKIDFYRSLVKKGRGYIGSNFFTDAHHPNLETYLLLANLFLEKLSPSTSLISMAEVKQKFHHDTFDKEAIFSRIQWLFFQSQIETYPFLRARDILRKLSEYRNLFQDFEIVAMQTLIQACSPYLKIKKKGRKLDARALKYLHQHFLFNKKIKLNFKNYIQVNIDNNNYDSDLKIQINQIIQLID